MQPCMLTKDTLWKSMAGPLQKHKCRLKNNHLIRFKSQVVSIRESSQLLRIKIFCSIILDSHLLILTNFVAFIFHYTVLMKFEELPM